MRVGRLEMNPTENMMEDSDVADNSPLTPYGLAEQQALGGVIGGAVRPMDPAEQAVIQAKHEAEHKAYLREERRQRDVERGDQQRLAALDAGLRVGNGDPAFVVKAAETFAKFLKGEDQ